nr:amidohydrolase family protein [Kibdelosporangium sp. MJ126-NF4]CEL20106.1 2-amino-3-carboxymuconate-6-semialdehyde decarboxylase [Kibdelosporangium sp. MJ126-NF4]CTQ97330.1 2-amino-3-carboxymuconate-6-semialdehyde decarboxylase (EC 4.1.1.45) [Kibdelosporangium sp. MJ126-NF4]
MRAIDVHGHVTSPELFKRFPMPPSLADIDGMIEQKLAVGIGMTIVGSPVGAGTMVPVPGLDNYAQPADQLATFHDWVGETVRSHWDNLRGYVYVNPFGDDDALATAAKLVGQPEFVGLIVNTSVRGEYLSSPGAESFFAMAHETGAPVLLHPPAEPVGATAMNGHLGLVEHVVRPCDITAGVASILFAGWLSKFPGLKLIAANAGGALSLLREKLDLAQHRARPGGPPVSDQLSLLYYDTATPSAVSLRAAASVFGADRLLFGTDSPPLTAPLPSSLNLIDTLDVTPEQRELVLSGTARTVFGLEES